MKRICTAFSGAVLYLLTHPTFVAAQSNGIGNGAGNGNGFGVGNGKGKPSSVPEIDASTGLLALAALGAALVLAWEINRRRKAT